MNEVDFIMVLFNYIFARPSICNSQKTIRESQPKYLVDLFKCETMENQIQTIHYLFCAVS